MCQAVLVPVLLAISLLAMAAWMYLFAWHGGFWRTDQRLPAAGAGDPAAWPDVVAVVPARDEAEMLPQTLPTLLNQWYEGELTVLLVDDESSDGTAEVATALGSGARLRVLAGEPTPPGWAGKVWAMAQGVRAAGEADFVLFTDADIGYAPGALTALVRSAIADDRVLVSQMALLRTDTFAERLLIPAFVYFFAQLYPFRRVNRRDSGTAAAAGGCMLVSRSALEAAGGLEPIRDARIDDVALGGLLKRAGGACWLGFTTEVVSRRRYERRQRDLGHGRSECLHPAPLLTAAAGWHGAGNDLAVPAAGCRHGGRPRDPRRRRYAVAGCRGSGVVGDHGCELPAGLAAQPPVPCVGHLPAADRGLVYGDDGQLSLAAQGREGRRMEGPYDPGACWPEMTRGGPWTGTRCALCSSH